MKLNSELFLTQTDWKTREVFDNLQKLFDNDRKLDIELLYFLNTQKHLDFRNIKSYGQYLQMVKLKMNAQKIHKYVDKLLVRNYVRKCGLSFLLPVIYEKYSDIKKIRRLTSPSILKLSNGWNENVLIDHALTKNELNNLLSKLKRWIDLPFGVYTAEPQYIGFKNSIYTEQYLGNDIDELKVYCHEGSALLYEIDRNRYTEHTRVFIDTNNKIMPITFQVSSKMKNPRISNSVFSSITKYAQILSRIFEQVRVDFILSHGKIYFSELTFTPSAGYKHFSPNSFDEHFAHLMKARSEA